MRRETMHAKRKSLVGGRGVGWVIFSLLALFLFAVGQAGAESLIKKGSEVPKFELPLVEGGSLKLQQELGKVPVLLLYWSLYCDHCRDDLPLIQKMADRLGPTKVKVLAINGDGKAAEKLVQGYWKQQRFTFASLLDDETKDGFYVEGLLGVEKTPAAVLVNPKGQVSFSQEGKIDLGVLEEAIRKAN